MESKWQSAAPVFGRSTVPAARACSMPPGGNGLDQRTATVVPAQSDVNIGKRVGLMEESLLFVVYRRR